VGWDLLAVLFAAIVATSLAHGCNEGLKTGVFSSIRHGTARRDSQPITYWTGVLAQGFASAVLLGMVAFWIWFRVGY
jgi:hypothetical protein